HRPQGGEERRAQLGRHLAALGTRLQGAEAPRLQVCRTDHRLCLAAGGRHRQRPCRRLFPPRPGERLILRSSPNHPAPSWGETSRNGSRRAPMAKEIIRVEPLSTWLENWKAPASPVTRGGGMVYLSALPPFDPATGTVADAPVERQTELVLEQMKLCLEA